MNNLPDFLQYFLYDILEGNPNFHIKKMFNAYAIYKNGKIFSFFYDGEFYFRKNIFNQNEKQMSYFSRGKEIFLPYFYLDESIFDDKELLNQYIESSTTSKVKCNF